MTPFWLSGWSTALSIGWLLPNHYPPWAAFHMDAWSALIFLCGAAAVLLRSRDPLAWHLSAVLVAAAVAIPLVQYLFGLIGFAGQAWVSSTYLLGLLLAMLMGQRWEEKAPGQLANGLLWAIAVAAIVSVNLQLQTWLGLMDTGIFDIWSMGLSGDRPYANLGQPNQLATLLIWGLLASAWAYQTRKIGSLASVLLASFLLIGIALTQSRTAWLGLTFLLLACWFWRRLWRSPSFPWVATGLFLFFWLCNPLLHELRDVLQLGTEGDYFRSGPQGDLRFAAWRLLISAAAEQPWFGYGWTNIGPAQLAVAKNFPPLYPAFGHSHNLFLDLVLWLGIPLGLLVSLGLVIWFISTWRQTKRAEDAILLMCLGAIGIHAMLEFPLNYAYFLLPAGAMVGILNARGTIRWTTPCWPAWCLWLIALLLTCLIIRDYFLVEASYRDARFESARIGTLPIGAPPDVWVLDQLRENINFMRAKPKTGMSEHEIENLVKVAVAYPGGGRSYRVATILALNGQPAQATEWLRTVCKLSNPAECAVIKHVWEREATGNPLLSAVVWPENN